MAKRVGPTRLSANRISAIFGVQTKTLNDRGVVGHGAPEGIVYDLAEFWEKCQDLVYKNLKFKHSDDEGLDDEDLKKQKSREEIRKLRILNDEKEGVLVSASDVELIYARGLRVICDKLDSIPSRVKMENPDIPQSVLDSINGILSKVRNEAADMEIEDDS